jgi:hypothetical protein
MIDEDVLERINLQNLVLTYHNEIKDRKWDELPRYYGVSRLKAMGLVDSKRYGYHVEHFPTQLFYDTLEEFESLEDGKVLVE